MVFSRRGNRFGTATCLALLLFVCSCFATATVQGPPPLTKRAGVAPTAAMLPILNTNDRALAELVERELAKCLEERNILRFSDTPQVQQVVRQSGYDLGKTFGLKDHEYQDLGQKLGVDYTVHGYLTVRKNLTLAGWRKDVDAYIFIHDAATGQKIDSWRSMTDMTFTSTETALDAEKMAESVVNHTCAKMMEVRF